MAKTIMTAAVLAAVLGGCAGEPGGSAIGRGYHIAPLPKNYKDMVTDYLKPRLSDHTIVRIGNAYQDSCRAGVNGLYHGWAVPVSYRAKKQARATSQQQIVWLNDNSVQMVSNKESGECVKA